MLIRFAWKPEPVVIDLPLIRQLYIAHANQIDANYG